MGGGEGGGVGCEWTFMGGYLYGWEVKWLGVKVHIGGLVRAGDRECVHSGRKDAQYGLQIRHMPLYGHEAFLNAGMRSIDD